MMVSSESLDLSEYTLFQIKQIFFYLKKSVFRWKREIFRFLFEILPKISYFVNSNDCGRKITSKSIRLNQFFLKKRCEVIKKYIFLLKKWENSGNCIFGYISLVLLKGFLIQCVILVNCTQYDWFTNFSQLCNQRKFPLAPKQTNGNWKHNQITFSVKKNLKSIPTNVYFEYVCTNVCIKRTQK